MPIKVWKKGEKWCAKWGNNGKTYCGTDRKKVVAKAEKQARAIYASGYREE
jgi:hypothetical protein